MRIVIFVLILASQTFAVMGGPSKIGMTDGVSGSDLLADDSKDEADDGKKKKRGWVPRKRTVIV
ncbi:hypothetical protein ACN2XU_11115 [Primorskyibacter sp. 2E107]|uniref:hypothetical protein n=1 Tax=Primorskyibacter sp. 2E107 TaxID=3403458 RepID=UPI003AF500E1